MYVPPFEHIPLTQNTYPRVKYLSPNCPHSTPNKSCARSSITNKANTWPTSQVNSSLCDAAHGLSYCSAVTFSTTIQTEQLARPNDLPLSSSPPDCIHIWADSVGHSTIYNSGATTDEPLNHYTMCNPCQHNTRHCYHARAPYNTIR